MKARKTREGSFFIYFAIFGGLVAAAIFFGAFILSSRANTPNPHANLRLAIPSIPPLPSITPRPRPSPRIALPTPVLVEESEVVNSSSPSAQ